MNSYINYTRSYSYAAVKCLTDPFGPMNDGALRPITVTAPEGSFLNPRPPAGGGPRAIICYRTFESVIGALARAVADDRADRKSTRLNSSHLVISYAVFCLKKKKKSDTPPIQD